MAKEGCREALHVYQGGVAVVEDRAQLLLIAQEYRNNHPPLLCILRQFSLPALRPLRYLTRQC